MNGQQMVQRWQEVRMDRFKVEVHKPMQHDSKLCLKEGDALQEISEDTNGQGVYASKLIIQVESSFLPHYFQPCDSCGTSPVGFSDPSSHPAFLIFPQLISQWISRPLLVLKCTVSEMQLLKSEITKKYLLLEEGSTLYCIKWISYNASENALRVYHVFVNR